MPKGKWGTLPQIAAMQRTRTTASTSSLTSHRPLRASTCRCSRPPTQSTTPERPATATATKRLPNPQHVSPRSFPSPLCRQSYSNQPAQTSISKDILGHRSLLAIQIQSNAKLWRFRAAVKVANVMRDHPQVASIGGLPTANMPHQFQFTSTDGLPIVCTRWGSRIPTRGVIQIAHGMGEHMGRYLSLIQTLVNAGLNVYANDHRGHGRTAPSAKQLGDFGQGRSEEHTSELQ